MIRTVWWYIRCEAWPRKGDILFSAQLWLSIAIGVIVGVRAPHLAAGTKLGDVLTIILAYAAVAFGFCVAGLTVALTLPDAAFARELATREPEHSYRYAKRKPNAYSDLLFVFSWTAIAHWLVILMGLVTLLTRGFDQAVARADTTTRAIDAVVAFLVAYAALQFLITLITLAQAGNAYITEIRKRETAPS